MNTCITRREALRLFTGAVATGALAACGVTPTPVPQATQPVAPSASASMGTLRISVARQLDALDPPLSLNALNWSVAMAIYDPLITSTPDGKFLPMLATAWENTDPLTWKFTLRQGVRFHDGKPFTSESVKYSLDRIVNPETKARQAGYWLAYDRTETPDDYTAIIKTKTPVANLLSFASVTMMVPPHAEKSLNEKPLGTGPFKFVEYIVDDHLTMEANPDYWQGPPKLERVMIVVLKEQTTRFAALLGDNIDLMDQVLPEQLDTASKTPGVALLKTPATHLTSLWMMADKAPFNVPKVREAVKKAIDNDSIINDIMAGNAVKPTGCLAQQVIGYTPQAPRQYDPVAAKALLAEAGYPDGFSTELKFDANGTKWKEIAEVIGAQLGQVGIKVKITPQDSALWAADLTVLNWEMNITSAGSTALDGDDPLRRFWRSDSTYKGLHWTPPNIDQLLLDQQAEVDPAKRKEIFSQVCKALWDDGPVVYLFNNVEIYGIRDRVTGFVPYPDQTLRLYGVSLK